jgi:hypothetical protein
MTTHRAKEHLSPGISKIPRSAIDLLTALRTLNPYAFPLFFRTTTDGTTFAPSLFGMELLNKKMLAAYNTFSLEHGLSLSKIGLNVNIMLKTTV